MGALLDCTCIACSAAFADQKLPCLSALHLKQP